MASSNPQQSDNSPPPKPWERTGGSSGPAPFKPPSAGSTSDVIEASGTAIPGEIVSNSDRNATINRNAVGRPLPSRPWEQNNVNSTYGGYGSGMNYNSGYGSGMYGSSSIGGYGGLNSGGMYGNSMYNRGGYGGGLYGSSGMYGGGMYNGGLGASMGGGPMGGYGMGMGGPYGDQDPNNPYGAPSAPPGFWMSFLRVMQGVVNFFGRISILVDQNTQAVHMFMSALLQTPYLAYSVCKISGHVLGSMSRTEEHLPNVHLFDRGGLLYGELARFVFRMLGIRTKSRKLQPPGPDGLPLPGPQNSQVNPSYNGQPKALPANSWDNVWGN